MGYVSLDLVRYGLALEALLGDRTDRKVWCFMASSSGLEATLHGSNETRRDSSHGHGIVGHSSASSTFIWLASVLDILSHVQEPI